MAENESRLSREELEQKLAEAEAEVRRYKWAARALTSFGLPKKIERWREAKTAKNPFPTPETEELVAASLNRFVYGSALTILLAILTAAVLITQTSLVRQQNELVDRQTEMLEFQSSLSASSLGDGLTLSIDNIEDNAPMITRDGEDRGNGTRYSIRVWNSTRSQIYLSYTGHDLEPLYPTEYPDHALAQSGGWQGWFDLTSIQAPPYGTVLTKPVPTPDPADGLTVPIPEPGTIMKVGAGETFFDLRVVVHEESCAPKVARVFYRYTFVPPTNYQDLSALNRGYADVVLPSPSVCAEDLQIDVYGENSRGSLIRDLIDLDSQDPGENVTSGDQPESVE